MPNSQYQGIDTMLWVGVENGDGSVVEDSAVSTAYGNRFYIPLDFELLESHMPFYQSALGTDWNTSSHSMSISE